MELVVQCVLLFVSVVIWCVGVYSMMVYDGVQYDGV